MVRDLDQPSDFQTLSPSCKTLCTKEICLDAQYGKAVELLDLKVDCLPHHVVILNVVLKLF